MLSHSFIYSFNKIYWEPVRPEEYRNKHNRRLETSQNKYFNGKDWDQLLGKI